MSDTTSPPVSRETIAQDFAAAMQGQMEPHQIDAAVQAIQADAASYPATFEIGDGRIRITITDGKTFTGETFPAAATGSGVVDTNVLGLLYAETVMFQFTSAPGYLSVNFCDDRLTVLGTFRAGTISVFYGTGGGEGSWS